MRRTRGEIGRRFLLVVAGFFLPAADDFAAAPAFTDVFVAELFADFFSPPLVLGVFFEESSGSADVEDWGNPTAERAPLSMPHAMPSASTNRHFILNRITLFISRGDAKRQNLSLPVYF
jgi:hypothetical protein